MPKKTKTQSNNLDLSDVLDQMIIWSTECGKILNKHLIESYKKPLKILDKGGQGVATIADILSEKYVMKEIRKKYPTHKILSEEDSYARKLRVRVENTDDYIWLIDPLDGTNNFYNRVPFFCVSLALNRGKETLVGVVYNPVTLELFYAIRGKGAYLLRMVGDRDIKVKLKVKNSGKHFKEALLSANLTSKRVTKDLLKEFPEVRAMRRFGSAALELCYVAAGMLDAYWEYNLRPWDMAAGGLICEEAGVKISEITGKSYQPFAPSVLSAHPALYGQLLDILSKTRVIRKS